MTWKFAVKTYLGHGEYVDSIKAVTNSKNDVKAKSKIILVVDAINYVHTETAVTAREVWINLRNSFEGC